MLKRITICCEGHSEVTYVQQLKTLVESWDGAFRPILNFFPILVGDCEWSLLQKNIKFGRKKNPGTTLCVWVDYDIYHHNHGGDTRRKYLTRAKTTSSFHFSFNNFEDFLILHYPPEMLHTWDSELKNTQHYTHPLRDSEYNHHFQKIIPGYRKGSLPSQFVNATTLSNLKRNLPNRTIKPSEDSEFNDFATFLINLLETAYPEKFS